MRKLAKNLVVQIKKIKTKLDEDSTLPYEQAPYERDLAKLHIR